MSTYQGIRGLKVRDYTTNPDDPLEGQLWYNKTDQVGKYQIPNVTAAWRTGNNLNTARSHIAGCGIQTAALDFAGLDPSPADGVALTESYDGTSWTEVNDMNTARYDLGGFGTYTSAIAMGGYVPASQALTESWNGSNWTEVGDLNQASGSL